MPLSGKSDEFPRQAAARVQMLVFAWTLPTLARVVRVPSSAAPASAAGQAAKDLAIGAEPDKRTALGSDERPCAAGKTAGKAANARDGEVAHLCVHLVPVRPSCASRRTRAPSVAVAAVSWRMP